MDWMIVFIMEIAVSVCRLTMYSSVNGVVVNFYTFVLYIYYVFIYYVFLLYPKRVIQ